MGCYCLSHYHVTETDWSILYHHHYLIAASVTHYLDACNPTLTEIGKIDIQWIKMEERSSCIKGSLSTFLFQMLDLIG